MLLLALAGFLTGLIALIKGHKNELREQWIVYAIGLLTALELAAVIANVFGRFNFSKITHQRLFQRNYCHSLFYGRYD